MKLSTAYRLLACVFEIMAAGSILVLAKALQWPWYYGLPFLALDVFLAQARELRRNANQAKERER